MARTIDRRAARTRQALHQALITLILRKGYEAITVQDIIDEADVGRSTFYAHYTGKEDLLRKGFQALGALLDGESEASGRGGRRGEPLPFSRALFEHACEYKHVYKALVGGRGGTVATNEIRRLLSDVVRRDLARYERAGLPADLVVRFVVETFLSVLGWSLKRKPHVPPAEMDAVFRQLVLQGIGAKHANAPGARAASSPAGAEAPP
ncbi:MAG TPA: TetR/AcrR family transcriptional regulator [Gammaproteobacteria bacterium]